MRKVLLLLGVALYRLGLARAIIAMSRKRLRVVLYHSITDTECDYIRDLRMSLDTCSFEKHAHYYQRFYHVVPASMLGGKLPPRPLLITFDDGYSTVFQNAWPILQQHSLPAIVYLVECSMRGRLIWINELNRALEFCPDQVKPMVQGLSDAPLKSSRECVLHVQEYCSPEQIVQLINDIRHIVPAESHHDLYLSEEQIREMQAGDIEFGYHSRDHFNLINCEPDEVRRQVSINTLGPLVNNNSFAYPFGYYNSQAIHSVSESGYDHIMTVGSNHQSQHPRHIDRTDVPYSNEAWLFAQLEVAEPVIALLRRLLH